MIPIHLELKNFFSHKESSLDFTQFDSALLIGNIEGNYDISNGSGKSSLFDSILWCLFNKARTASMDDIIFWGENYCKVVFTFKHNGDLYRVTRKRSRVNSLTYVEFARQDDLGNWIDISGSTSSLTNAEIEKVIKLDYKTFVNSIYFGQKDISEFAESDASGKKTILKSIIDISKWDEYEDQAKNKLREMKNGAKILASRLEGFEELINEHDVVQETLGESKLKLEEFLKRRKIAENEIQDLTKRYTEIKETLDTERWDKTTEIIEKLKSDLIVVSAKFKDVNKNYTEYKELVETKTKNVESLSNKIIGLNTDEKVDGKIKLLEAESMDLKVKLSSSKELYNLLKERVITQGECYVCSQSITEDLYTQLIHSHDEGLDKHLNNQIFCQNKLSEISTKLQGLEKIKENNKLRDNLNNKIKTLKMELRIAEERVATLGKEHSDLELDIIRIKNDLSINDKVLESIRNDDFKSLQNKLFSSKKDYQVLSTQIEKINHDVGVLTEKTSNLKSRIDEIKTTKKEHNAQLKDIAVIEKMVKLFGKNGIQVILLNAVIEDLEKTTNEILTSICNEPFAIFLDTQRIGSDGVSIVDTLDLRVKKEGVVQNFKSLSCGEQFRISLALRIALSEISSRHGGSSLEFLLLDEINSPLDKHGTESLFVNVIKTLEKKYKILVITHNDSLKEKFVNVIDITKINGESSINYIPV